jgi:hypothetical protein
MVLEKDLLRNVKSLTIFPKVVAAGDRRRRQILLNSRLADHWYHFSLTTDLQIHWHWR